MSAVFLGHALQYERIFLWNPRGKHVGQEFVDPGCGRGESYTNWDCLFEPLSICAAGNATRCAGTDWGSDRASRPDTGGGPPNADDPSLALTGVTQDCVAMFTCNIR